MVMRTRTIWLGVAIAALAAGAASAQSAQDAGALLGQLLGKGAAAPPQSSGAPPPGVSSSEASGGLKLALGKAAERVVAQLGRPGGFADDPRVRIGLPGPLGRLNGLLSTLDRAGVTDGLSGKLNAAAEGAVGKALPLLKSAITRMTVTDALGIVTGGNTSATDYFRRMMGPDLQQAMMPVVSKSLSGVKAFQALDRFSAKNSLIAGQFGARDLTSYVTEKASDGVFLYLGEQEREIRRNPLGTGSKLIAKIFGRG